MNYMYEEIALEGLRKYKHCTIATLTKKELLTIKSLEDTNNKYILYSLSLLVKRFTVHKLEIDEETLILVSALDKYLSRLKRFGLYTDSPQGRRFERQALSKILGVEEKPMLIPCIIPRRDYMINDSSKFKNDFFDFLMKKEVSEVYEYDINPRSNTDNYYGFQKDTKAPLTIGHVALLIALESIFISCSKYVVDGELVLYKSDLFSLFGENFRGSREDVFCNMISFLAQVIVRIDIGTKQISPSGFVTSSVNGKIEGNLLSYLKVTDSNTKNYVLKIKMPFIEKLLKNKTINTMKSIDMIRHVFKNPKLMLLGEKISNVCFYHRRKFLSKGQKIQSKSLSLQTILEYLGEYNNYINMERRKCNTYLKRLQKDIEILEDNLLSVSKIDIDSFSKSSINDPSCGITIHFNDDYKDKNILE